MSNEGAISGQGGPAGRADGAATPRRRPGDKPFIPFARFEDVVARCGHVEKFGLMPDGKDRFREGRRQKVTSRDCKACREKRRLEQEAAAQLWPLIAPTAVQIAVGPLTPPAPHAGEGADEAAGKPR